MKSKITTAAEGRDLTLSCLIEAPCELVFRAWTEPELLKLWFAPHPYTTPVVETDVRPGGSNLIVVRGPDGNEISNRGVYLEVEKNEKIVFTDAFSSAWELSQKPFMTIILTFEDRDGRTKYTARVRHWSETDREFHEKMGFHSGWTMCAEQLAELVEETMMCV
ncbi:MAG TPA: SRPBCC family protein [Terracidiphilus sp.]|jgi:uncharacterized protein YndB with AHSA1/START domain